MYQSEIICPIINHNRPIDRICTLQFCNEAVKTICSECSHQNYHIHGSYQKTHQIKISEYYVQLSEKLSQQNKEFQQSNELIVQSIKTLERLKYDQEKLISQNCELQYKIEKNQLNREDIQKSLINYHNQLGSIQVKTNQYKIQHVNQILNNNDMRRTQENQNQLFSTIKNSPIVNQATNTVKSQQTFKFDSINSVAICREKNYVAVGDGKSLKIINLKQNRIAQALDLGENIKCIFYSYRDNQILIGFENGQIGLYTYDSNCLLAEKQRFNYSKHSIQKVNFISSDQICSINLNGQLEIINLKETNIKNQVIRNIEFNGKDAFKPICNISYCNLKKILIASKAGYLLCWQMDKIENYIINQIKDENIGHIQINTLYIICSGFKQNKLYFYELNKSNGEKQLQLSLKMNLQFDNQILSFYLGIGIGCQLFIDLQGKIQVLEIDKFKINIKDEYEMAYSDEIYSITQPNLLDYLLVTREKQLIIFKR